MVQWSGANLGTGVQKVFSGANLNPQGVLEFLENARMQGRNLTKEKFNAITIKSLGIWQMIAKERKLKDLDLMMRHVWLRMVILTLRGTSHGYHRIGCL